MHIPDGYVGPATSLTLYAAMVPAWAIAGRHVRRSFDALEVPLLALGGAFAFVVMLFNVALPGGTSGHAVGAAIVAIALGPAAAVVAMTVALAIQALIFGDGGVLALGANCFNMALVMPVAAYGVYQALGGGRASPARRAFASGVAGYVSVVLAALATAIELGLQPAIEPGHCPYGLGVALKAMLIPHLLVIGWIEGLATAGVVGYLARGAAAEAPAGGGGPRAAGPVGRALRAPASGRARALWAGVGVLCLASPIGLLAAGTAWGEWAPEELKERLGYTPPGLARLGDLWRGVFPDYRVRGLGESLGYVVSAALGVAAVALVLFLAHLRRRRG
jgi:cobalt/nickel transport system permease protein